MRIYAVLSNNAEDHARMAALGYPYVLASYEATQDPSALPYRPTLLLDSGAFSVWTLGRKVEITDYIEWARGLRDSWGTEVRLLNLDVIPGEFTRQPTASERARAIRESAENAGTIRAAGLPVVEVYHRFEAIPALEAILERRQTGELIAFGGLVGRSGGTKGKMEFCDEAFAFVRAWCGGWGQLVPIHGLGVSGDAPLARRYPWYSVDSTTWMTARNFNLHVASDGGFVPRNRVTAPRTTKDMAALFMLRRLELWERTMVTMSEAWERRGVRFIDDALAAA